MIIDIHMHLTEPVSLLVGKLRALGVKRGIICSSAVARGEAITTLKDARAMMGRVGRHPKQPDGLFRGQNQQDHYGGGQSVSRAALGLRQG